MTAIPVTPQQVWDHMVKWEGYRLKPYRDGPSAWSVGVGHNLTANRQPVHSSYTSLQVYHFFLADLSWSLDVCRSGIRDFDDLPQDVQLVCLGVAWTTGRTGFLRFRQLRLALSYRSYLLASTQLRLTPWARQVSPARRDHYLGVLRVHAR